ncbi:hypothetical protein D1B31_18555 [Neobacillus notoginsengisoli]|uniref:Uncharacterized protein n=1 Tax=Neobacillus notoginsengisoli TaxID=1578198 RepID=A0A417YQF3_9BACI|nr:hypothetical protein [Neobacillus notoginsengisoli]RHW36080.1 hypothetical protein D1B31_18555 [Neobacillus notoginsengisoli]
MRKAEVSSPQTKVTYRVFYRVQSGQGFVEITLFVESSFNECLVAQKEGMFDTMEDAKTMISYLESIGADIEYNESAAYKG